ncbi:MAG TPA: glycosyltransferase family 2 protein [Candidatus Obscuribacterales bacterium]
MPESDKTSDILPSVVNAMRNEEQSLPVMLDTAASQDYLLSVVVPMFNEEHVAPECMRRLKDVVEKMNCRYELIFINDGSKDRTLEALIKNKADNPHIRIINFSRNFGHQIAITAGLDHAQGDAVVIIDGDLQDPPELIPKLVEKWRQGAEIVHARRKTREGESRFKKLTAKFYYRLLKEISDVEIPVDVGDFRLLSKRAAQSFAQLRERHRYVRGLVAWLGFKQDFVDYDRQARYAGATHYPFLRMLRFSLDGISSFSILPLRLASMLGLLCALAGALYAIYALYIKYISKTAVLGWTSIIMVVLFVGGIQLICLGIVGEYVGILHDEIKRRPLYLIDDIY